MLPAPRHWGQERLEPSPLQAPLWTEMKDPASSTRQLFQTASRKQSATHRPKGPFYLLCLAHPRLPRQVRPRLQQSALRPSPTHATTRSALCPCILRAAPRHSPGPGPGPGPQSPPATNQPELVRGLGRAEEGKKPGGSGLEVSESQFSHSPLPQCSFFNSNPDHYVKSNQILRVLGLNSYKAYMIPECGRASRAEAGGDSCK